jgi:hypothetical protein
MGCFDIFCILCGNPYRQAFEEEEEDEFKAINYKKVREDTKWMNDCTMLLASGEVVKNVSEDSCNGDFIDNNKKTYFAIYDGSIRDKFWLKHGIDRGLFIHTDCYEYLSNKIGKELRFDMFNISINKNNGSILQQLYNIEYGDIENYWDQNFNFVEITLDKKYYYLSSPLDNNKKNIIRLNKIISQFNIKKTKRIGPEISASISELNIYRIGNDNNIWQNIKHKWTKITNLEIIYINYNINEFFANTNTNNYYKFRQICEPNIYPLFYIIKNEEELELIGPKNMLLNINNKSKKRK